MKTFKIRTLLLICVLAAIQLVFSKSVYAIDVEWPCNGSSSHKAGRDCYNPVLAEKFLTNPSEVDDVFEFCTYGSKVANVFIRPEKNGIRETTTLCAHNCTPEMTTYNKHIKGDTSPPLTRPHEKARPDPTMSDPATCNPVNCNPFIPVGCNCVPKYCPCTNVVVAALWMSTCSFREKGKYVPY